jgi:hypothetical protein
MDPNKPAEPNKSTIISASDFGTYAKDVNKPDVNKPAEPNKSKMCAVSENSKSCDKDKDANKPADPNCKK